MTQRRQAEPPTEPDPELQYEVPSDTPTFYCDSIHLNTGVYGATLYLGELRPGKNPLLRARLKISPQMLKALQLLTKSHVQQYESRIGTISFPNELIRQWGLEEDVR